MDKCLFSNQSCRVAATAWKHLLLPVVCVKDFRGVANVVYNEGTVIHASEHLPD